MTDFIKGLIEKRANVWEQTKEILERAATEDRDLTAEERASFDKANADLDLIDERVKALTEGATRAADIEASLRDIARTPRTDSAPPAGSDLRSFLTGASGARSFELRAGRPMGTEEYRALSKATAAAGLNTVKTSFYDRLVAHLIEVSGVMQTGPTVLTTSSGEALQVPKTTAHSTAGLVAEAAAIGASDPAFGMVTLNAYKYGLLLQVSHELAADTSVDLEGYIAMQAGRALGNAFGNHLVTGTGSSQPNGVLNAASLGVTGAASVGGAFSADNVIDLMYSVIAPYRNSASCAWMLKDASLAAVRKLKDTTNQYLWQPSLQVGAPDTLLGKPIVTDPFMPAVALSAKSVLFGDFSQYFVRQVESIRLERSLDYAFNTDLITYRCLLRGDGNLVDVTGAVKYFQGNAA